MCLFLFPSEHDFNFPSCRALLQCSVLPEILPFYQGTILCMYIALRWKTLLAFLKIAAEDRRSHPWQCAKESNAGAPQGHFSTVFNLLCLQGNLWGQTLRGWRKKPEQLDEKPRKVQKPCRNNHKIHGTGLRGKCYENQPKREKQ